MHDDEVAYDYDGSPLEFAREGSALRAESADNPRNLPCPNCGKPDRLTPKDQRLGYQCDECAEAAEQGFDGPFPLTSSHEVRDF